MKVDIAIIGAEKCGTTSLKEYLGALPGVCTHFDKECPYFLEGRAGRKSLESHFPLDFEGKVVLLKNVGILEDRDALRRLVKHNPHVKTIVMLRDPIRRAVSAHAFARRNGLETRPRLVDCLASGGDRADNYMERSRYEISVPEALRIIGPDRVHVGSLEQLKQNPDRFMKELCDWLGLDYGGFEHWRQHNQAMEARSALFGKLLRARFPMRGVIRKLVPYRLRVRIRNGLKRANEKPLGNTFPLSLDEQYLLGQHFAQTYAFVAHHYPCISSVWSGRDSANRQDDSTDQ